MKTAILVPKAAFEKRNAQNEAPCLCKDTPVRLVYKKGSINWLINVGDTIARGEPVCEALVEKAVLEILAPAGGKLAEKCLQDGDSFAFGDTLGYIDDDTSGCPMPVLSVWQKFKTADKNTPVLDITI